MKNLHFQNMDAMKDYFAVEEPQTYLELMLDIKEANYKGKKDIKLYEISFDDDSYVYTVALERAEWVNSLKKALEYFTNNSYEDYAIDTWQVLQEIK